MKSTADMPKRESAETAPSSNNQNWKSLYLLGGILTFLWGIGGLVAFRLAAHLYSPAYPGNPEAYLQLISQKQPLANGLWSLWILGDFMFILPSIAFYLVLRRDHNVLAFSGMLFSLFYIFFDISVTELNSLTLVSLAHGYSGAATEALRASFVAAATYGYYALPLQTVFSFGVGAVGWFLWSLVMLKGRAFPRWMAIFGLIVNGIGIIGAPAPVVPGVFLLGLFQYFAAPLTALWAIVLGIALYRFGLRLSANEKQGWME